MPAPTTIRSFLQQTVKSLEKAKLAHGHGASNALDEACFIILEGLGLPIDNINPYLNRKLNVAEKAKLQSLVDKRIATRKPAAYLLNRMYQQGVPFYVDERVIVPRSYIGELMATGLFESGVLDFDPAKVKSILDLCTGSGCIAILAALHFPKAKVTASELSEKALEVAKINVAEHKLTRRITLQQGDLFAPLKGQAFDLILANPPYVAKGEVDAFPPEYAAEPQMAHLGGSDGLDLVRRIIRDAPKHLNKGGALLCEVGTQGEKLIDEFQQHEFFWLDTEESVGEVFFLTF